MLPTKSGALRLFRLWGIEVFIHWSWFLVAFYSISTRVKSYDSPVWAAAEYFALMLFVLMHEFGHSTACRSVGGQADQIVLWPLGGVAYVNPPQRPGATLWSIAAGPLVNVVLVPVLFGLLLWVDRTEWVQQVPDAGRFFYTIYLINFGLLIFNLLPMYPLDGGQILRSVLWYPLGRARSLMVATIIGLVGGVAFLGYAFYRQSLWNGVMAFFLLSICWRGLQEAKAIRKVEQLPRHDGFACPECHTPPPAGPYWRCRACSQPFDPFTTNGTCPHCATVSEITFCPNCGAGKPLRSWDRSIREA
ncbi:MAG: M50 family metallopeptidase [Verrucomicrobia bacterium]|nr:M50 family metallopeptidase [Verrucomicrobiota bacterium]